MPSKFHFPLGVNVTFFTWPQRRWCMRTRLQCHHPIFNNKSPRSMLEVSLTPHTLFIINTDFSLVLSILSLFDLSSPLKPTWLMISVPFLCSVGRSVLVENQGVDLQALRFLEMYAPDSICTSQTLGGEKKVSMILNRPKMVLGLLMGYFVEDINIGTLILSSCQPTSSCIPAFWKHLTIVNRWSSRTLKESILYRTLQFMVLRNAHLSSKLQRSFGLSHSSIPGFYNLNLLL